MLWWPSENTQTTQLLYADNNNKAQMHILFLIFTRWRIPLYCPIWDIMPVTARNNLSPKDALEHTLQLAVLLVTTFLVDVDDWRLVACYAWQDQSTRLMLVCVLRKSMQLAKYWSRLKNLQIAYMYLCKYRLKTFNCNQQLKNVSSLCPFSTISTHTCWSN